MDRRGFLTSLAVAPLAIRKLITPQTAEYQPSGYPDIVQDFLESQLELDYRCYSLKRDPIQKENLRTAFSIVAPRTNTDLAFIVWCGEKYLPVADVAYRYHNSRQSGRSGRCDQYPCISLDHFRIPDTGGIFAFKEELAALLSELTDLNYREAMQALFAVYRGAHEQFQRNKIDAVDLQGMLKPRYHDRYTLEEVKRLHTFISDCYGNSGYYSMALITVERALNMLS